MLIVVAGSYESLKKMITLRAKLKKEESVTKSNDFNHKRISIRDKLLIKEVSAMVDLQL